MSFGMLLALAFLLLVSLVITAALPAFGDVLGGMLPGAISGVVLRALNAAATLIAISLLFALLFRYVPDADIAWQDVWVGAEFTQVWARQRGGGVQPAPDAVRLVEHAEVKPNTAQDRREPAGERDRPG